ncbi:predicted protein [Postia placenta Mad-698-R]|nr:predicted protein [Postia placenta Mad-698-R]
MSLPQIQKAWRATAKGEPSKVLRLDDNVPVPKLNRGEVAVKLLIHHHTAAAVKERKGALAQYASISASHIVRRPVNVTPTQAAGIPLAAMTAYQALFDVAHLKPEQHVFINGGSTAVGGFAIQIAKSIGCKVVASASGKNESYVRSLGADEFVDYTTGPLHATLAANPPSQKYHVFLETVGLLETSLYTSSEAYLAPGGIFLDSAGSPDLEVSCYLDIPYFGLADNARSGKIKPLVDSVYNFDDALKAYERIMTGRATGKVVVKVDLETE